MVKILFIGDIVGSLGRSAVGKVLPTLKKRDNINLVIANGENLAHGRGASRRVIQQVLDAGVDFLTSGDHIFDNVDFKNEIDYLPIIRPANFPKDLPGFGYKVIELPSGGSFLVISLLGRTFIDYEGLANPFDKVDEILANFKSKKLVGILVDFHAEATSEKVAMGWYLDGRVSAVMGTHTHVPTADARILPQGTAFVADVGMVGACDSVLGVQKEIIINRFKDPEARIRFEWVEEGEVIFNSVLIEINENTEASKIERVDLVIQEDGEQETENRLQRIDGRGENF